MIAGCLAPVEDPVHLHAARARAGSARLSAKTRSVSSSQTSGRSEPPTRTCGTNSPLAVQAVAEHRRAITSWYQKRQSCADRGAQVDPGREDVQRQVALEALRRPQAEQEADPAAPVVADQLHPLEPELVEHREHVGGHVLLLVAVAGRVGPAEAAQVERDRPVAGRPAPASGGATRTSAAASRAGRGRRRRPSPLRPRGNRARAPRTVAVADAVDVRQLGHRAGPPPSVALRRPSPRCGGSPRAARPSSRRCRRPFPARPSPGGPASVFRPLPLITATTVSSGADLALRGELRRARRSWCRRRAR